MTMGVRILAPQAIENSLFSDLRAFRLHFGPQVVSRHHLGTKMMRKRTPKEPQGPQNDENVMKNWMEF